jgi:hypothetical protein
VSVDVRIVTATNLPLEQAVRNGRFRSDLYHRLSHIQLRVPPLRERPEDIVALASHFLAQSHPGISLSFEALEIMRTYGWPGNVRELRNVIMQAATLAEGSAIRASDLPAEMIGTRESISVQPANGQSDATALDDMERNAILRTLERVGGHQGMAAEQLGISRRTLSRKLKQYNLESSTQPSVVPLGTLSGAEQQYFRATVDLPVQITTPDAQIVGKALNVSAGGVALDSVPDPLRLANGFAIRFDLPGGGGCIETKAQLVWAEPQGRAGVRFVDIIPDARDRLNRWLLQKQKEEGWHIGV